MLARDRDTAGKLAEDTGTEVAAGAATGALAGGLLGGVAGWLIGIGALAIPGVGPIIAAGPLAAALGGAALGAATGGIIGALTGVGVPEDEARYYDDGVPARRYRGDRAGSRPLQRSPMRSCASTVAAMLRLRRPRTPRGTRRPRASARATSSGMAPAGAWDDVEPAHRFGYESYGRTRKPALGRLQRPHEPTLREEWSQQRHRPRRTTPHRNDVRRGWDYGRGRHHFRDYDGDDLGTEGENAAATGGGAVARWRSWRRGRRGRRWPARRGGWRCDRRHGWRDGRRRRRRDPA